MPMAVGGKAHNKLAVFLNNKIITCDTVVPLIMDVHAANPEVDIEFYIVDWRSYQVIRENRVLWDAIHRVGRMVFWGRSPEERKKGRLNWLVHRIKTMAMIGGLALQGLIGKAKFVHFRGLNEWPLRLLYLAAPKSTYLCENTVTGYSENERRVDNTWAQRSEHHDAACAQGGLIAFTPDWRQLDAACVSNTPKYVQGNFWYGKTWPEFIRSTADGYLEEDLAKAGLQGAPEVIIYILGFLGEVESVKQADTFKNLFHKTLQALYEEAPGIPVLIKPHFNTDVQYLREAIDRFKNHSFIITHLHPAVLSTRARFLVANYYSTTMAVARSFGVEIVEYSQYGDEAMKITEGKGMRPDIVDHYINDDETEFRNTVKQIMSMPAQTREATPQEDPSGIIDVLAGKAG